jgi:hypothetical protein
MSPLDQAQSSFVVRIWREEADAAQDRASWRGWVQHTRSGDSVYIRDLEGMLTFMERWIGQLSHEDESPSRLK